MALFKNIFKRNKTKSEKPEKKKVTTSKKPNIKLEEENKISKELLDEKRRELEQARVTSIEKKKVEIDNTSEKVKEKTQKEEEVKEEETQKEEETKKEEVKEKVKKNDQIVTAKTKLKVIANKEIINSLAKNQNVTFAEAEEFVDTMTSVIKDTIKEDKKININGFGIYEPKINKARTGINPRTKEKIMIKESKTIKFKPAKGFKDYLNN